MAIQNYRDERLQQSIKWYDNSSTFNRIAYYVTQLVSIVCAAIIPFLSGLDVGGARHYAVVTGILGVVIAVMTAVSSVGRFHELWIKHRTTAEALKRERFLFDSGVDPYVPPNDPDKLLVARTETILSQENASWAQVMTNPAGGQGGQTGQKTQ